MSQAGRVDHQLAVQVLSSQGLLVGLMPLQPLV